MNENSWWLSDYALFMAVKGRFDNVEWTKWAEDIRLRWKDAMDYYREELYYDIEFQQYMQFKFHEQWMKLKAYANENGSRSLEISRFILLWTVRIPGHIRNCFS